MISQKPNEEQYLSTCYLGDDKRECFDKGYIAGIQEVLGLLFDRGCHVDKESDYAYWCAKYVLSQLTPEPLVLYCPQCSKQHIDTLEADGTDWSKRPHKRHLCKNTPEGPDTGCGVLWAPRQTYTIGVLNVPRAAD